jgi:hypothetical protein
VAEIYTDNGKGFGRWLRFIPITVKVLAAAEIYTDIGISFAVQASTDVG